MDYRVRILSRAQHDAQSIFDWLEPHSRQGAVRWWAALEAAIQLVGASPQQFGLAPESSLSSLALHQFFFKTRHGRMYRGVFVIVENEVRVLRIRGPGQAPLADDELPKH